MYRRHMLSITPHAVWGSKIKNNMRLGVKKCQWHFDSAAENRRSQFPKLLFAYH